MHRVVAVRQQALQFEHGLARDDHFVAAASRSPSSSVSQKARRWPSVATTRTACAVGDQQQPVQVVADVLLRHREVHHLEQVLQLLLRQRERGRELVVDGDRRELLGAQGLQRKRLLPAWIVAFRFVDRDRHLGDLREARSGCRSACAPTPWWRWPRCRIRSTRWSGSGSRRRWPGTRRRSPSLRNNTLARIGSVCLRSTMPATVVQRLQDRVTRGFNELHVSLIPLGVVGKGASIPWITRPQPCPARLCG